MPVPTLTFNPERMFTRIRGFAQAKGWTDTLSALGFARKAHMGQDRKDGLPYIVHPLTMACHAIALGVHDDCVVAALLLRDVPEDCGVDARDLPVSQETKEIVLALTHMKAVPNAAYYAPIQTKPKAALCKIFDRCHNVSTMSGVFSLKKTRDYIREADEFVMPLFPVVKEAFPQWSDAIFVLKYHVMSVDNSLRAILAMPEISDKGGA